MKESRKGSLGNAYFKQPKTGTRGVRAPHDRGECRQDCWYCMHDWPMRKMRATVRYANVDLALDATEYLGADGIVGSWE